MGLGEAEHWVSPTLPWTSKPAAHRVNNGARLVQVSKWQQILVAKLYQTGFI